MNNFNTGANEQPQPLAPVARAFISYAENTGPQQLIPATHEFILDRVYEATHIPYVPRLLPQEMIKQKMGSIIVAEQANLQDAVIADNRNKERGPFIDTALEYHSLPEVREAIRLHAQLRSLGRNKEKRAVEGVLEALGRTILTLPAGSGILQWAEFMRDYRVR